LIGWISRADIIRAYERALTRRVAIQQTLTQARLGVTAGVDVVEYVAEAGSAIDGHTLTEVSWPEESLVASIQRGGHLIIPNGHTLLQAGDHLTVICKQGEEKELARLFAKTSQKEMKSQK
jgi:Trk K+ transport system NAD-binding subunit